MELEKCIGCGPCVTACPTMAISLLKRENYQVLPVTYPELLMRMKETKKGSKIEKFKSIIKHLIASYLVMYNSKAF